MLYFVLYFESFLIFLMVWFILTLAFILVCIAVFFLIFSEKMKIQSFKSTKIDQVIVGGCIVGLFSSLGYIIDHNRAEVSDTGYVSYSVYKEESLNFHSNLKSITPDYAQNFALFEQDKKITNLELSKAKTLHLDLKRISNLEKLRVEGEKAKELVGKIKSELGR